MSKVSATIAYLQACQKARAAGRQVSFTDDPGWLVNMAINRRAGWPDDPGMTRGSCMPVAGRYPKRAEGDGEFQDSYRLADYLRAGNTRVWPREVPARYRSRLQQRFRSFEE